VAPNDNRPTDEFDLSTGQGFERFVLACQTRVFRFLGGKGVNTHDAEDLCQDAILTLWQNRQKPRNPQTFVIGIAMAYHRKRVLLRTVSLEDVPAEVHAVAAAEPPAVDDPPAGPTPSTTRVALLDKLTPRLREVIELVQLQGVSRRDAARQLGITALPRVAGPPPHER
jgi:DNA-directed RNA polymerase specialized sigma24 family protein